MADYFKRVALVRFNPAGNGYTQIVLCKQTAPDGYVV